MDIKEECEHEIALVIARAKKHQWKWVTANELLCDKPCILIFAALTAAAATADVTIYNGENTSGEIVCVLEASTGSTRQVNFIEHIYCNTGLYVAKGTAVTGVLVVWHPLPHGM